MLHGNIYPKEKVPQALTHFFRTDNLIALRELALRFVADESDENSSSTSGSTSLRFRGTRPSASWRPSPPNRGPTSCSGAPRASHSGSRRNSTWSTSSPMTPARPADGRPIDQLRALAADLGARWHEIDDSDPARALVSFAREHQITQIVIGSIQSSWWHIVGGGPILRQVIHEAGAFGIDVHIIAHRELPPAAAPESTGAKES